MSIGWSACEYDWMVSSEHFVHIISFSVLSYIIWYLVATSETKDMAYPFGYTIICIDLSKINKTTQPRAVECRKKCAWMIHDTIKHHMLQYAFTFPSIMLLSFVYLKFYYKE